jgi:hypothetical protein
MGAFLWFNDHNKMNEKRLQILGERAAQIFFVWSFHACFVTLSSHKESYLLVSSVCASVSRLRIDYLWPVDCGSDSTEISPIVARPFSSISTQHFFIVTFSLSLVVIHDITRTPSSILELREKLLLKEIIMEIGDAFELQYPSSCLAFAHTTQPDMRLARLSNSKHSAVIHHHLLRCT